MDNRKTWYIINDLFLPNFIYWNLVTENVVVLGEGVVGRWLELEFRAFTNRFNALPKEVLQLPHPFDHLRMLGDYAVHREADTQYADSWILDLPHSQKKKSVVSKLHTLLQQPKQLRQQR